MSERARWAAIFGHYLLGVFSAAQLGKMSALAPVVAADLNLSLTTVAGAISLLEAGGALLGAVAGLLASRLGLRRTLLGGLACLMVAGFGTAFWPAAAVAGATFALLALPLAWTALAPLSRRGRGRVSAAAR